MPIEMQNPKRNKQLTEITRGFTLDSLTRSWIVAYVYYLSIYSSVSILEIFFHFCLSIRMSGLSIFSELEQADAGNQPQPSHPITSNNVSWEMYPQV